VPPRREADRSEVVAAAGAAPLEWPGGDRGDRAGARPAEGFPPNRRGADRRGRGRTSARGRGPLPSRRRALARPLAPAPSRFGSKAFPLCHPAPTPNAWVPWATGRWRPR